MKIYSYKFKISSLDIEILVENFFLQLYEYAISMSSGRYIKLVFLFKDFVEFMSEIFFFFNVIVFISLQVIFLYLQHFLLKIKGQKESQTLELDHLAFSFLISSQFKMLASLNGQHPLGSAVRLNTFQP